MMSENRCNRCNRKLTNPSATYGATCARIMGVREAYEQSGRDTRDDFDHSAHLTADKLKNMGVNWVTEDGQILYRQLFAQEFGKSPQVIPAKESKGAIEQAIHDKETDYEIQKFSNRGTANSPKATEPGTPANYQTTDQSAVRAMEHINAYDENMTQAQKDAWMAEYRKLLKEVEWEYSEENLKNRAYDSVIDMRIEYDRILYFNAFAMNAAYRNTGPNGEYLPEEVRKETLALTNQAVYNMEEDIIARAIFKEAASGNQEDYNAVAQIIINRYDSSAGSENSAANKHYYRISEGTRQGIQGKIGNDNIEDVMPYMHIYGRGDDGNFYVYSKYSRAGLVLASGQFSGLTSDGNEPALDPHAAIASGHKNQADWDMAYAAAEIIMQPRGNERGTGERSTSNPVAHESLAKNGWTQFRAARVIEKQADGSIILTSKDDDGKITKTLYRKGQYLYFGGNYYLGEGEKI